MNANSDYLDGNAAAGELSRTFAMDVTVAQGQCANCGATKRFAEAHLYIAGSWHGGRGAQFASTYFFV